jgi:hypothetical protein
MLPNDHLLPLYAIHLSCRPVWWVPKAAVTSFPSLEGTNKCAKAINDITDAPEPRQAGSREIDAAQYKSLTRNFIKNWVPRNKGEELPGTDQGEPSKKAAGTKAEVQYNGNPDEATKYYEAQAMVAYGHVEIKSKHTGKKFDEGFLETTLLYIVGDDEVNPDSVTYIAAPYRYDLTLKSSGSYDKY